MKPFKLNADPGKRTPVEIKLPPGHAQRCARRAKAKSDKRILMVVERIHFDLNDPVMLWLVDKRLPTQCLSIGTKLGDRIRELKMSWSKRQRQYRKSLYAHIAATFDYAILVRNSTVLTRRFEALPEALALPRPPRKRDDVLGAMLQLTMNNHNDASAAKKRIEHLWNTEGASGADVYQFLVAQKLRKPTASKPPSGAGQSPVVIAPPAGGVQKARDAEAVDEAEDHAATASNDTPKSAAEVSDVILILRAEGTALKQDHLAALRNGATVNARIMFQYDSTKKRQVAITRSLNIT